MITQKIIYIADCDGCGREFDDFGNDYDNESDLLSEIKQEDGWTVADNGEIYCGTCREHYKTITNE
jgi:hypothetical protein